MSGQETLPSSQHFQLQAIAAGVFVAQATPGSGAASNAGIIDLGDQTIIFDTFLTPPAAAELLAVAETLTASPVKLVINSHYHSDHIGGNQLFPASVNIVATSTTRQLMLERALTPDAKQAQSQQRLAALETQLTAARNAAERQEIQQTITQTQWLLDALPTLQPRVPNLTFDQRLVLYGRDRQVELLTYGGGHSPSDAILYLPAEQIVFAGDLLSIHCHPFLGDGDPGELPRILDQIDRLQPTILVPGHGPVGSRADIGLMQQYLAVMTEVALTELAFQTDTGTDVNKRITQLRPAKAFANWQRADFFAANLHFLYQRVMTAYAE